MSPVKDIAKNKIVYLFPTGWRVVGGICFLFAAGLGGAVAQILGLVTWLNIVNNQGNDYPGRVECSNDNGEGGGVGEST